jgi:hypothetical protein
MTFEFVENFTIQLPDLSESTYDFSEGFNENYGLIIEVAAIHERINC